MLRTSLAGTFWATVSGETARESARSGIPRCSAMRLNNAVATRLFDEPCSQMKTTVASEGESSGLPPPRAGAESALTTPTIATADLRHFQRGRFAALRSVMVLLLARTGMEQRLDGSVFGKAGRLHSEARHGRSDNRHTDPAQSMIFPACPRNSHGA